MSNGFAEEFSRGFGNAINDSSYGIAALSGVMLIFALIIMVIAFAVAVLQIVAMWKLFNKAGKPGWASIVPVYNIIVLFEIIGYKWYYIFLFLLGWVPIVGQLALVIFSIVIKGIWKRHRLWYRISIFTSSIYANICI